MSGAVTGIALTVTVGGLRVERCPRLELVSERHAPLSLGRMDLPDPSGALFSQLAVKQEATVSLGYRGKSASSWFGRVSGVERGPARDQVTVRMQGLTELPLVTTIITESWRNEAPETILARCIGPAGLSVAQIDSPGVALPHFPVATLPIWAVARQLAHTVQHAHGLDMGAWALWLGADGVHWGDHDEEGDVPLVATGAGLIRHDPAIQGVRAWAEVETFLVPGLTHSRQFRLEDGPRGISGKYRVQRVRHVVTPWKGRTYIAYGAEHGRY